jgi:oligosaccharide repeat unit polymerase
MFDFAYVSEMYADTADMTAAQTGRGFSNIGSIFRNSFSEVIVFFPFYYALYEKRNKIITILLWLSMLNPLLSSFRLGSRTMMSWWVLEVIVAFLFFRRYYAYDVRKRINKAVYSAIAGVVFVFAILTIGRFATGMYQNDSYVGGSLLSYAGQSTLNFSDDVLQNDVYQHGDNCFPLFRRIVGLESSSNLYERQAKWSLKMKIRQGSFYTFIGDLYNDFSPILGLLLLSIISFILYSFFNKKNGCVLSSPKAYLIFFLACVLYNGLFYFSYKGTGGNLRIIVNLLFIVLLRVLSPTLNRSYNA